MSIPDRLPHALHNEQLCSHLSVVGGYNDWVVTTAFYSALHYVQSRMFPMTVTNPYTGTAITLDNFPAYYGLFKSVHNRSKHAVTLMLVANKLPATYNAYKRLYDACMSARYNNYQVSAAMAALAQKSLLVVKGACMPPVVPVSNTNQGSNTP